MMFTGDAVGSGDIFLSRTSASIYAYDLDNYIETLEKYKAEHGIKTMKMFPGHLENKHPFYDDYIYDMRKAAYGILDGSLFLRPYSRRVAYYATVNLSNIRFNLDGTLAAKRETFAELQSVLAQADGILPDEYTAESYQLFKSAYDEFVKAVTDKYAPNGTKGIPLFNFVGKGSEATIQAMIQQVKDALVLLTKK